LEDVHTSALEFMSLFLVIYVLLNQFDKVVPYAAFNSFAKTWRQECSCAAPV